MDPKMKHPTMSIDLRFDAEKHHYYLGDKRIPGVSEILAKVGLSKDYKGVDSFYRDRGIACHKAIELHLKGILDPESLDDAIKPQFRAFQAYWESHKQEEIVSLELPRMDLNKSFCGTPDLITGAAIYDWKCSKAHDKVADLQGQAYKILDLHGRIPPRGVLARPFIVVELHDDGTFQEFNYGPDYEEWASVMALYRWRIK